MSNDLNADNTGNPVHRFMPKGGFSQILPVSGGKSASVEILKPIFEGPDGLWATGDKDAALDKLRKALQSRVMLGSVYKQVRDQIMSMELIDTAASGKPETYNVKGLIVQLSAASRELDAYYGAMHPDARSRQSFEGSIFYLPPGRENDRVRAHLSEGRRIMIDSFIPSEVLDRAAHDPGTITFENLELRIGSANRLMAVDPRPACAVPGTPQHAERVHQKYRAIFNEQANDPCVDCACGKKKAFIPQL